MSPYFQEDLSFLPQSWHKTLGEDRIQNFNQVNFNEIALSIKCPVWIFIGQEEAQEYPQLALRVRAAHQLIENSQLIEIKNATHDIDNPYYVAAISRCI